VLSDSEVLRMTGEAQDDRRKQRSFVVALLRMTMRLPRSPTGSLAMTE